MRTAVARLALLLISTALCLVLVEQLLRALDFEYRPMSIEVVNKADARLFHLFEDEHFVYDPELIWRPRRSYGVFNEQGFRGPLLTPRKPAGETRIFALGDSNTLGWAGEKGPNWPQDLGRILGELDPRVAVVNAGVWGYTSYQGTIRLEEVLVYQPDLVLISFGANDAHLVRRGDREFAGRSLVGRGSMQRLLRYRTAQLATAAWDRLVGGGGEPVHRVELDAYRSNLRRMADAARRAGAIPVFLTRPSIGPVKDLGWWKAFADRYNLASVEVAEEVGAPVVDLYSLFREQAPMFSDESHFTGEGHELAADILARHLLPLLAGATAFEPAPARRRSAGGDANPE